MKRPLGVGIISFFYIFGSAVLIYTAIFYHPNADQFGIAARFGVPMLPEQPVRLTVAAIALAHAQQPFMGNVIWSAIVLVYTLIHRRSFQIRNRHAYD